VAFLSLAAVTYSLDAAPYASGVRSTGNNMWQFVLNAPADNVTVLRNGGNALELGALAAGRHTFSMMGFNTFDIVVSDSAPVQWTRTSNPGNLFTNFEQPTGLAINTDPASPFFGTVYVNNSRTSATASTPLDPPPRPSRNMGSGIYALTADLIGVDLANNFAAVTNPQDTSQAKAPGWTANTTSTSPWRMTLDDGNNLIVGDWSDDFGGVKYAAPELLTGGLVLDEEGGPSGGVPSSVSDDLGPIPLHGSIASKPIVTGRVGVDLTLWAMDEDLDVDLDIPGDDGNSIWRWDVGSATNYDINPKLVIDVGEIPQTTEATPRANFLNSNAGIPANAHFETQHDKWYLTQRGSGAANTGDSAGLVIVSADGMDGSSPTLEWSSLQFSIDHGLDGNTTVDGIQDIFKHAGSVAISPDGTKLFVHRSRMTDAGGVDSNPVLGPTSNTPGIVLVIPLDANGVPEITVEAGELTNVESITLTGNDRFHTNYEIDFDAAGNLYVTHSDAELLEVYSPGGDTIATTSWNGTQFSFDIETPMAGLTGDFNGNGTVDAADYVLWRNGDALQNEGGVTPGSATPEDYQTWRTNFGKSGGGAAGLVAAVPEPGAAALVAIAMCIIAWSRSAARRG
jgi:hypothetical protein